MKIHSQEAEQHVLACALADQNAVADVLDMQDEWMYQNEHKLILRAIRALAESNLTTDSFAVGTHLQQQQQLEMAGGMEYLVSLSDSLPSLKMLPSFKNELIRCHKVRQLAQIKQDLEMQLETSAKPEEVVESLQQSMIDLMTDHHQGGFKTVESHLDSVLKEVEWRQENAGKLLGQSTGHNALDYATDGMQEGRVYVLAGRPGAGKTAFALSLADGLSQNDKHWFYFSLEMTGKSLAKRLLVTNSGVANYKFRSGRFDEPDFAAMGAGIGKIQGINLHVDETPSLSINQIRSRLKAAQIKHKTIGGVVIDHIGLIKKANGKTDTEAMNMIADDLLRLAKEFNCPMLELCQLNRGVETRTDKRPMMADLKQSGKIEENADVIMLLYRGDYYDKQESPVTEVDIAKNRDGETKTVYMRHDMSLGKYEEMPDYEPPVQEQKTKF